MQHKISLLAASRTDRGVHAVGQTVTFILEKDLPLDKLQFILNSILPKDIRVFDAFFVSETFHPSLDALKKEYVYSIETNEIQLPFDRFTSWHYPYKLNKQAMQEGANLLIGRKDFKAFQNSGVEKISTVREIEAISIEGESFYHFTLIGNSFLYKMVRNIVGTLVYIGCGKLKVSDLEKILTSNLRENAGVCAPPHGLTLKRVYYDFEK